MDNMEAELKRLQGEVPNLRTCLDAAQEQILKLENQVQIQKLLQNENQEAQALIQGVYQQLKCEMSFFNVENTSSYSISMSRGSCG